MCFLFCLFNVSSEIQDPLVLLDPVLLAEALLEWLLVLERILGPSDLGSAAVSESNQDGVELSRSSSLNLLEQGKPSETVTVQRRESSELEEKVDQCETLDFSEEILVCGSPPETLRVTPPVPIPSELLSKLTELATLYTELSYFKKQKEGLECNTFLRHYFFLLDHERVQRMCLLCYQEQPEVRSSFMEAMLGKKGPLKYSVTFSLFLFLSIYSVFIKKTINRFETYIFS